MPPQGVYVWFRAPIQFPLVIFGCAVPAMGTASAKGTGSMSTEFDVPTVLADLSFASNGETPNLTVIVPTRNEKHSIEMLLARLGPAVAPLGAELIFVDDSDDETPAIGLRQTAWPAPGGSSCPLQPPGWSRTSSRVGWRW